MIQRVCPVCRSELTAGPEGFACEPCRTQYPRIGSLECLVKEPRTFCATWLSRLQRYAALVSERAAGLTLEANEPGPSELTRERLIRLARALEVELSMLSSLFGPMAALAGEPSARSMVEWLVDDPLAVSRYSEHLFRDWVWGSEENARTLGLIAPLMPADCGSLAVFGAGTGVLALNLAQHGLAREVYALDINPLPLLVADHLLTGAGLMLPEFPQFPISAENVAIWRQMHFEAERPAGLHLVLADALEPPFAARSFDAVLTPWFIDAVPVDVSDSARAVNRSLRPGGTWLNVGPLQFGDDSARAYSIEEVHQIVKSSGFELLATSTHDLPYFDSPVSGSRRIDRTYVFKARKVADLAEPVSPDNAAAAELLEPVPATGRIQSALQRAVLTAGIASLVDGKRTVRDIATALARDWKVPPDELVGPLSELLSRLV